MTFPLSVSCSVSNLNSSPPRWFPARRAFVAAIGLANRFHTEALLAWIALGRGRGGTLASRAGI
jgi:hypothetical protein